MLPGHLSWLWGSERGFLQWQQQHDHSAAAPVLDPLTCSAPHCLCSISFILFHPSNQVGVKGIFKNFFKIKCTFLLMFALLHRKQRFRDSEMPSNILRMLTTQSPSCWSAPLSCCESMPCALDSCTKTNLVDFHNYYNLIINPPVWTPHRTVWRRSHAFRWEMPQNCVLNEKVVHQSGGYTLHHRKQNSMLRLFRIIMWFSCLDS